MNLTRIILKKDAKETTKKALAQFKGWLEEGETDLYINLYYSVKPNEKILSIFLNFYWVDLPLEEIFILTNWEE